MIQTFFSRLLDIIEILSWSCLVFGGSYYSFLTIFTLKSKGFLASNRPNKRPAPNRVDDDLLPGVTLAMPAYNEEVVIVGCVTSALASDYPNVEVIVVSDGSKDRTIEVVIEAFEMERDTGIHGTDHIHTKHIRAVYRSTKEPRLLLIDKDPSGAKADGINCAINFSRMPWVAIMDADELLNRDTLRKCMTEAVHTPGNVVCVGTTLLPTNEGNIVDFEMIEARVARNKWVGFQIVEYLSAFMSSRPGQAAFHALTFVSGGFGLYRRDVLLLVDGQKHGSLGEDLDLATRVHRYMRDNKIPYEFVQVPEAIVWTEFPFTKAVLQRQRLRWHRGLREIMNDYKDLILRPKYGKFGMISLGQMFLFEWCAPIIEGIGYAVLATLLLAGRVTPVMAFSMWMMSQSFGTLMSVLSVSIASKYVDVYRRTSDRMWLLMWAILMQFGYRQLTLYWRLMSFRTPKVKGWGEMTRAGFGPTPAKK